MLVRSLVLLGACLFAAQLLSALPLEPEHPETLLNQESDQLSLESSNDAVVREKRTIGFLRQAFPTLSQIIDRKIQAITRLVFRLIGRLVLRGNGGGGGNSDSSDDDSDRRVQITLPTFPPSPEDDEDEDEDEDSTGSSDDSTTTTTEPSEEENALAESRVAPVVVRKTRQAPAASASEEEYEDDDQAAAATGDNEVSQSAEEDADDTESAESDTNEDDPRNKRFLSLGGGSGGSGGGSGNFLFDIIRLVAGSGTTQNQDEAENAPLDETNTTSSGKADDGYSAGVPGPLTRLFVIANRGIANLIQDLILRLAQTSERIVNFKARLITSII